MTKPRSKLRARRKKSCPLPNERHSLVLRAESGEEIECEIFAAADDSVVCGILHEPTRIAEIEDLPREWPVSEAPSCDSAQLQCGHVFHVSAIALHFLVGNMRCPVCRAGVADRMHIECVPLPIRLPYEEKVERMQIAENEPLRLEEIRDDVRNVLANLELVFSILGEGAGAPPRTTARTRIVWSPEHLEIIQQQVVTNIGEAVEFGLQRSFQRLVRSVVSRQLEHNSAGLVRFSLQHPLVPVNIVSKEISVADAWNGFFNTLDDACVAKNENLTARSQPDPILLYCAAVAGSDYVGVIKAAYDNISAAPQITTQINTLMLVNIASYVRQVIESIRDAVEQHTSFDAQSAFEFTNNAINGLVFAT